ncbi:GIY-YIG nuclease family protein [Vibrio europaeus]|uniref:GIY-YIG nuclease family protein n=1 Tax=Vibrio europaeus TaxID=300876 RepID=A0AAE7AY93_9VIBR|nr:GIY-YIG nuclease family protein [Vibrio europaeus]MDC5806289.1 GIY-YIG nuclease family protein [Vibrio europaeus]MDC5812602.1 GIY-YIG nuclease family protein [Vibrio europaeus]MDC5819558.1 GIY-YIG nuclease family protein [Vibrio europaeus]MDC5825717.1 GIY-YIG nuclease family protein [Vibrio europaeus]MDC5831002.1 GIY-YIG nuclease family protein [Vibrio europaeus]
MPELEPNELNACSNWYVYLIRMRNNALYCGITTDVQRRFNQHQQGTGAKALKGKGPLKLEWFKPAGADRSSASKLEYQLKRLPKHKKEQLIAHQQDFVLD